MKHQEHKSAIFCEDAKCEGCLHRRFRVNLPAVRFVMRKYFYAASRPGHFGNERDMDDMLQAGRMGLWHACVRRDPARSDADWRGYAFTCIRGYILISLRDNGKEAFARTNGGARPNMLSVDWSSLESADHLHGRNERLTRQALAKLVERQYEIGNRPWWDLGSLVTGQFERLDAAIETLPERLRVILRARLDEESLQKVSERFSISHERIRQLQVQALKKVYLSIHGVAAPEETFLEMTSALNMFENG